MATTDFSSVGFGSGLPSEAEIENLAGALFGSLGSTGFEPETCAKGINDFVTTGNTAVFDRAAQKLNALSAQGASYVPRANAEFNAVSEPAQKIIPLTDSYAELSRISTESTSLTQEAANAAPQASNLAPSIPTGLAGFSGFDFAGGNLLNGATGSTLDNAFADIARYAETSAGLAPEATPYLTAADSLVPKAPALSPAIPTDLSGYGLAPKGVPQEQNGYSPVVLSQEEAKNYVARSAPRKALAAQNTRRGVHDDSNVIVGTKTLAQIRADFPILRERINGYPLVWLDNGATTQRPQQVIDRLSYYYEHENSNVHRGAHELAARSTDAYENARKTVAQFLGAPDSESIVFVRGTTEGINLVAHSYVKQYLTPGDEIIVSYLEHHANIVPWQLIAQETGAVLKVIPVDETGQLRLDAYERLFTPRTKFVAATHVSNALGTVTPVAELVAIAHAHGVRILIDGAQSVAHIPVNLATLDADFFVFSGHKIYAPTGIGAVYGKKELLEAARPYHGGGNMILDVTFERTIYNKVPNKFEAGTGSIADAVGLGAALEYLQQIGMEAVSAHEHSLLTYAMAEMRKIPGLHLVGTAANKASVLSFVLDGVDNETVGARLNELGIAVRTGHHCAQPILRHFGLEGTVRPTLALYNSFNDVDALVAGIRTLV